MRVLEGPLRDHAQSELAERVESIWADAHRKANIELLNGISCGARRSLGGRKWSVQAAEREVLGLVADLSLGTTYPTRRQFQDGGLGGLISAIDQQFGGHRAFADRLGLSMVRRIWPRPVAEQTVLELIAKLNLGSTYPTARQFFENDLYGLHDAITKLFGGQRAFAESLGLTPKRHGKWTPQEARREVLRLVSSLELGSRYPTREQFGQNGLLSLNDSIRRFGGHEKLAKELGLTMRYQRWTVNNAPEHVLSLVQKLDLGIAYPTSPQFNENGLGGLCNAIPKLFGSHQELASSLGLRRVRTSWNEELAQQGVSALVDELGLGRQYPTLRQFSLKGRGDLYQAIPRIFGGHKQLADILGLARVHVSWDEEKAKTELLTLVDELGLGKRYPTEKQFMASGRGGLYQVIILRFGGHRSFSERLRLTMRAYKTTRG